MCYRILLFNVLLWINIYIIELNQGSTSNSETVDTSVKTFGLAADESRDSL